MALGTGRSSGTSGERGNYSAPGGWLGDPLVREPRHLLRPAADGRLRATALHSRGRPHARALRWFPQNTLMGRAGHLVTASHGDRRDESPRGASGRSRVRVVFPASSVPRGRSAEAGDLDPSGVAASACHSHGAQARAGTRGSSAPCACALLPNCAPWSPKFPRLGFLSRGVAVARLPLSVASAGPGGRRQLVRGPEPWVGVVRQEPPRSPRTEMSEPQLPHSGDASAEPAPASVRWVQGSHPTPQRACPAQGL